MEEYNFCPVCKTTFNLVHKCEVPLVALTASVDSKGNIHVQYSSPDGYKLNSIINQL